MYLVCKYVTPVYHLYIVMNYRRSESMANVSGRWNRLPLPLYLVFSTTGGMGREALTFYRRLADMLSRHSSTSYSGTLTWIRCTLSFSLLRSATMCIRGTVTLQVVPRRMLSGQTNYRDSSSPAGPCKVTAYGPPFCSWSPQ